MDASRGPDIIAVGVSRFSIVKAGCFKPSSRIPGLHRCPWKIPSGASLSLEAAKLAIEESIGQGGAHYEPSPHFTVRERGRGRW